MWFVYNILGRGANLYPPARPSQPSPARGKGFKPPPAFGGHPLSKGGFLSPRLRVKWGFLIPDL